MAQQVKVLATMPDSLSSTPGTLEGEEDQLLQCCSLDPPVHYGMQCPPNTQTDRQTHTYTHTHTQRKTFKHVRINKSLNVVV